jgi:hypothetical protein
MQSTDRITRPRTAQIKTPDTTRPPPTPGLETTDTSLSFQKTLPVPRQPAGSPALTQPGKVASADYICGISRPQIVVLAGPGIIVLIRMSVSPTSAAATDQVVHIAAFAAA